eukprot:scaffold75607_cov41-Attheya_sp.AAC.1
MAKSAKTNPASPTKASKLTKIPSPRRKKDGYEDKLDAYCLHLKEDLDRARPIQEGLNLVAGYPQRTNFWRRGFRRVPSQESTTETRLLAAQDLAEYLSTHDTNTYRTPWIVDPATFDLTADTYEERLSLDEYMMDTDIIEYMLNHLEMPDTDNAHWARENIYMLHYYFNDPTFPRLAVTTFGFPS